MDLSDEDDDLDDLDDSSECSDSSTGGDDNEDDTQCSREFQPRGPIWKVADFSPRCTLDTTPPQVHSNRLCLRFAYFTKYFPETFWKLCAEEETNLYSVQTRAHRSVRTSASEMTKLAGIHLLMGLLALPRARLYWSRISAIPLVAENKTRDQFFDLRGMLHFVDITQTGITN
ncbi:hypothetical protein HPB48_022433 [Haemaphysalis longicornis]|uniref:PiggyBac transposable element-derived protein domain-containing protein n=1 Tax=Haemaphysalis longicornis TaxID=44386 RepID=A0A9J6GUP9_HAELO|nr:hypothetical protein HPB48_022433 [Haemaphysalis longicornis]